MVSHSASTLLYAQPINHVSGDTFVVGKADRGEKKMLSPSEKVLFIVSKASSAAEATSNAFIWKINENVWRFHLMRKPHQPQFNCSILCGSGCRFFFPSRPQSHSQRKNHFRIRRVSHSHVKFVYELFFPFLITAMTLRPQVTNKCLRRSNRELQQSFANTCSALSRLNSTSPERTLRNSNYEAMKWLFRGKNWCWCWEVL